jgi:NADPH2:quinone reductase
MKSIGFTHSLAIDEEQSLYEFETPMPEPGARDLLVEIKAVSVNPADGKRRIRTAIDKPHDEPLVLGYDAVGVVTKVGAEVTLFSVGDEVWYAGDAARAGSNTQFQLVDERVVGPKPKSLSNGEAAAMPLTGLTSWEMLFDRFGIVEGGGEGKTLLVIGGAGGVGSLTIQIARQLTKLTVIATASREESAAWCRDMGAHDVVDHRDLVADMKAKGYETADYITQYADTAQHWDSMCDLVAPQGKIGTIVETNELIDISKLQGKSAALHWELMFTRALFQTEDMAEQNKILTRISELVDSGTLRTTAQQFLKGFSAETLKEGHRRVEKGSTIGKIVIEY